MSEQDLGRTHQLGLLRSGEIRLLELHPGAHDAPVSTSLHHVPLDSKPSFEALSYVWGDPTLTQPIKCDHRDVAITQNLYDALRQFRLFRESRYLWVDALCINQQDRRERETEVQRMHDIYASASNVLAWLGPSDEHSAPALDIIKQMTYLHCKRFNVAPEDLDEQLQKDGTDPLASREIGFNGLPGPDSRQWGSLYAFLSRPYFDRVWVVQEIYFAKKVLFYCGENTLTYSQLYYTVNWGLENAHEIDWQSMKDLWPYFALGTQGNIMDMRPTDDLAERQTLVSLLNHTKRLSATDPRDKVYGMMNFKPFRQTVAGFPVDYLMSVQELYASITVAVIRKTQDLHALTMVDHAHDEIADFASWIPRWNRRDEKPSAASAWYNFFNASDPARTPSPTIELLPNQILCVSGFQFDTVREVCDIVRGGESATPRWKPGFMSAQPWTPYKIGDAPYPTEEDLTTAYALTLTACCTEYEGVFAMYCRDDIVAQQRVDFIAWLQWLRSDETAPGHNARNGARHYPPGFYSRDKPSVDLEAEEAERYAAHFHSMTKMYTLGRRLFRTSRGWLGLGSGGVLPGDRVCVLFGGKVPFILRPRRCGHGFDLVGDAYVHGVMHGEAVDLWKRGNLDAEVFQLY